MTRTERKAMAIGKALAKAINQMERFDDDPDMILDEADIHAKRFERGVLGTRDVISFIRDYYKSL